ncbi:fused DSP-PTPase phosphatase/NAD kinase-like protein [Segnochrobactrum spirostomi]|uniref:Protein tyrosine phosphatase n=1 Tax=Segnochrobactrum spirostomi TaxID=2608987 RepID=A0A6A7Y1Y0_9HYPH|nr:sulfur transferase domain-containing protein [Segnochrobactrum spirostomi]MQT13090.1 protein tyrosine phosphatase [Segnochrobactrum spirostomi]
MKFFRTAEGRERHRDRLRHRSARPIDGLPRRLAAWWHLYVTDVGLARLFYRNRHQVDARLWRSSQPSPADIAWAARQGIRTVVWLRGDRELGGFALEREACERHGLTLVTLPLWSRSPPTAEMVRAAARLFETIEYPALVHCKSGSDRAGLASALYLILAAGRPVEEALGQLSLRYGHVPSSKTGVLDAFLEAYRDDGAAKGQSLIEWVEGGGYDPAALKGSYRSTLWSDLLVDRILRRE